MQFKREKEPVMMLIRREYVLFNLTQHSNSQVLKKIIYKLTFYSIQVLNILDKTEADMVFLLKIMPTPITFPLSPQLVLTKLALITD